MLKARNILQINYNDTILDDSKFISLTRNQILHGDVVLIKNVLEKKLIRNIKNYLANLGKSSIPNYQSITEGAPNYHRINHWDDRSYVKGCFHQFSFFPWNQDIFNFFSLTRNIFFLKNLLNNQPRDNFLKMKSENSCIARLSFQFYPKGIGSLNKHSDPVDHHQLTVPTLVMSKRGIDYETGGVYVESQNQEHIFIEDECEIGDVILFNAQIPHGVITIDEHKEIDWLSFEGRWMMIFATNKLLNNQTISNAKELE
jgi:hypothetical protein